MAPEPLDLAYLAGVIDSDGYITIHRRTKNARAYHYPQVGIAGTRRQPHDLAASLWGGRVGLYLPKNVQHRAQYQWTRQGDSAVVVIEAVRPYLRVKTAQADLALELWEHLLFGKSEDPFPWQGSDYDPAKDRDVMRAEMVDLNQSRSRLRTFAGRTHDAFPLPPEDPNS